MIGYLPDQTQLTSKLKPADLNKDLELDFTEKEVKAKYTKQKVEKEKPIYTQTYLNQTFASELKSKVDNVTANQPNQAIALFEQCEQRAKRGKLV